MRFIYAILITTSLFSMDDRTYMSVGNFPDNIKAVCYNNELYAQQTEDNQIVLNKLYRMKEGEEVPIKCEDGKLLLKGSK